MMHGQKNIVFIDMVRLRNSPKVLSEVRRWGQHLKLVDDSSLDRICTAALFCTWHLYLSFWFLRKTKHLPQI